MTVTDAVLVLLEVSVAFAVIVFAPKESVIALLQDIVPDACCQLPPSIFTSTLLRPTLSEAVPLTVILDVVKVCPFVGEAMVIVGFCVSIPEGLYITVMAEIQ